MSDAVKPPEALPYLPLHLVGADPGDTELLTLAAIRAIKRADVILYDHLVGPGVLEFSRRDAERILAACRT
jgi:siroheme synthase